MGVLGTGNTDSPGKPNGLNMSAAGNGSTPPPAGGGARAGAPGAGAPGGVGGPNGPAGGLSISGGAAIVAPVSAFPGGIPQNALIVLPLSQPPEELTQAMAKGPLALELDAMWKLLGFNGPAVQVQDAEGRPIAIGLEDLLAGLDQHW